MSFKDAKEEWEEYFNEHDEFFGIVEPRLDDDFWQKRYSAIKLKSVDGFYHLKRFATTKEGLYKATKLIRRLRTKELFQGFKFVRKKGSVWKDLDYSTDKEILTIRENRNGKLKKLVCLDGRRYIKHNYWGTKDETTSE